MKTIPVHEILITFKFYSIKNLKSLGYISKENYLDLTEHNLTCGNGN